MYFEMLILYTYFEYTKYSLYMNDLT